MQCSRPDHEPPPRGKLHCFSHTLKRTRDPIQTTRPEITTGRASPLGKVRSPQNEKTPRRDPLAGECNRLGRPYKSALSGTARGGRAANSSRQATPECGERRPPQSL